MSDKMRLEARGTTEVFDTEDGMIAIQQEQMGETETIYLLKHDVPKIVAWLEKLAKGDGAQPADPDQRR